MIEANHEEFLIYMFKNNLFPSSCKTERDIRQHEEHPELHWRLLDRTKHGRVHINSRHVKVEFYIHHDDYANGRQLADILASEIETMGESLSDMSLAEEVEKCC